MQQETDGLWWINKKIIMTDLEKKYINDLEVLLAKNARVINDLEALINSRISSVEVNVIDKITSQFMQTLDNERNSQIRFQCEYEKRQNDFEHKVRTHLDSLQSTLMSMDNKITPKWHSLLIIAISIVSFSTIIIMLLSKL